MQNKDTLQDPQRLCPCEATSGWRELLAHGRQIQGIMVLLPFGGVLQLPAQLWGMHLERERHDELKLIQRSNQTEEVLRTTSEEGQPTALEVFLLENRDVRKA